MKLKRTTSNELRFYCLGCKTDHAVWHAKNAEYPDHTVWDWNGSMDNPTFTPSILVKTGHYAYSESRTHCWCTYNKEHPNKPSPFTCQRCHSFITLGQIKYLHDCTHEFAGLTIELPDWNTVK